MATDTTASDEQVAPARKPKQPPKKSSARKKSAKAKPPKKSASKPAKEKRKRVVRPYPGDSFKSTLELGVAIVTFASGQRVRRLTLLEQMKRSPTSHATQVLITNSGKYAITKGSYQAEWLELTPDGVLACDSTAAPKEQLAARFRLAIEHIAPFKQLYDEYVGKRLPAREVMKDLLTAADLDATGRDECVDLFVVNVTDLGLLRQIGGAQTLVSIDAALDTLGTTRETSPPSPQQVAHVAGAPVAGIRNWVKVCFYISPIGDENSDARRHSDMFMQSLIAPAMDELELEVVRADQIGEPGMITAQVIEHIRLSQLCIADLSMLNPNVFYETCLRHACRRPIVQIIQKADRLPFDVNQVNSLVIDTTSMYSFVPQIETYRAQIATLARKAIEDPTRAGNPISVFYPTFWTGIDTAAT